MIIVGCSSITKGTATFDSAQAPEYRASVASSIAVSESQHQVALTKAAVHTSCDALGSSSSESVEAVNGYVEAYNDDAPDAPSKIGPAVDSLNQSADQVAGSLSAPLTPDLTSALNGWVDSARQLAAVFASLSCRIAPLNSSGPGLRVRTACDAAY
jgi:hypothetical protein